MSAFVVEKATIDRIVTAVWPWARGGGSFHVAEPPKALVQIIGQDCNLDALGQMLWDMNRRAVAQRYAEDPTPAWYNWENRASDQEQLFMSVCCLLYQCSEGNVPEEPLFEALDQYKVVLALKIAHQVCECQGARWE